MQRYGGLEFLSCILLCLCAQIPFSRHPGSQIPPRAAQFVADGEAVPLQLTAAWREASPAVPPQKTTTPKAVEPCQCPFDLFKVVSSFRSISAGGAFCTTQRLAFVGRLRRPFADVRANPRLKILHSSLFIFQSPPSSPSGREPPPWPPPSSSSLSEPWPPPDAEPLPEGLPPAMRE